MVLQAVKDGVGSDGKANCKAGGDGDSDGEGLATATIFCYFLLTNLMIVLKATLMTADWG